MARKKTRIETSKKLRRNFWSYGKFILIIPVIIFAVLFTWIYQTKNIIWTIGSETITKDEVRLEIERLKPPDYEQKIKSITDPKEKLETENALQAKAMENLLKLKCVYLYAKEKGYKVTKEDIKKVTDAFQKSLEASGSKSETIKEVLADYKISYRSFMNDMRDQAIYDKVLEPVKKEVVATEEEMKAQYDKNPTLYDIKEMAHMLLISVATEPEAIDIVKKLEKGEDFKKLAQEKSLASDAATNGGDIGWQTKDNLLQEIGENVFHPDIKLNVAYPIQARDGWYVFIVKEKKPAQKKTFEMAKELVREDVLYMKQNQAVDAFMVRLTEKYESLVKVGNPWENFLKWWDKQRGKIS